MRLYVCHSCARQVEADQAQVCQTCGGAFCSLCMSLTPVGEPPALEPLRCHRCDGVTAAAGLARRRRAGVVEL